eukprot:6395246-Amphidinium_carterae.1
MPWGSRQSIPFLVILTTFTRMFRSLALELDDVVRALKPTTSICGSSGNCTSPSPRTRRDSATSSPTMSVICSGDSQHRRNIVFAHYGQLDGLARMRCQRCVVELRNDFGHT